MTSPGSSGAIAIEHARGGSYVLTSSVVLPRPIDVFFAFFSDAHNLERLTPPWLGFHVLTPAPITVERGATIDYRLRVHGVPLRWTSEIDLWEPPHRFRDSQRRGPYRRWVHEHTFAGVGETTAVGDRVEFEVPGGRLPGALAARDVRRIFVYRRERLHALFGR